MTLLSVDGLRKTFGGIVAVEDVSFDVDRKEIAGGGKPLSRIHIRRCRRPLTRITRWTPHPYINT